MNEQEEIEQLLIQQQELLRQQELLLNQIEEQRNEMILKFKSSY